ncbi:MAG TPA: histidinol-phosphate transaminase [Candidatus Binatia bacterium]|nr:histidinol-phosphate transaminase [Candidatus Binatia bacterium]
MTEPSSALVRKAVLERKPYRAGTTIEQARKRFGLGRVVKLSSNENPLGTPAAALDALHRLDQLNVYDDDDYPELRAAAARQYGAAPENVIAGHGSNELVWLAFSTFVDPGEHVVMAKPTFSLFPKYAHVQGAKVSEVPLRDGVHDLDAMLAAVGGRTKLVVLCDPNNPTGTAVQRADFTRFLGKIPETVLVLIDQAYGEYMPENVHVDGVAVALSRPNVLVARTMSKIYGMASARVGYMLGNPTLIDWMRRIRVPFNVSGPSMAAAIAAFGDRDFVERSIALNVAGKAYVDREYARLGLFAYPTAANFVAVRVPAVAERAYEDLMRRGVVVRSGDGVDLPNFLRITVGTQAENEALIGALEELLPTWRKRPAALA